MELNGRASTMAATRETRRPDSETRPEDPCVSERGGVERFLVGLKRRREGPRALGRGAGAPGRTGAARKGAVPTRGRAAQGGGSHAASGGREDIGVRGPLRGPPHHTEREREGGGWEIPE